MIKKGKFIVLEGGDGSGKDTHLGRTKRRLEGNEGVVFVHDPGGTPAGERFREILLHEGLCAETELLVFLASRCELVHKVIAPALEAGKHVISGRFSLSTIAYQICGGQRPDFLPWFKDITGPVTAKAEPDHYLFFDIAPEIAFERMRRQNRKFDNFEKRDLGFHTRVLEGYRKHIHDFKSAHIIDASRPLEEVSAEVDQIMHEWLPDVFG